MLNLNGRLSWTTSRIILPIMFALASSGIAFLLSNGIPFDIPFLKTAQLKTIDQRFEYRGPIDFRKSSDVVIVGITDQTFEVLPHSYPFPRSYYARMIKNLFAAGAKVVGIDITMDDSLRSEGGDSSFSAALRKYKPVVLAVRPNIDFAGRYTILRSSDFYHNIFAKDDNLLGVVLVRNDIDGVYRRYLPYNIFQVGQNSYQEVPTFGFAILSQYLGLGNRLAVDHNSYFQLGNIRIPKYDDSSMLINYPGAMGSFPTYDLWQVLDDSSFTTRDEKRFGMQINDYYNLKSAGVFKNKIVLVGALYPESADLKPIPFSGNRSGESGNLAYGVEIHASAIETVLDHDFLARPSPLADFLEMFGGALLIAFSSTLFKSVKRSRLFLVILVPLLVTGVVIFLSYEAALVLFAKDGLVLDVIYPIFGFSLSYVSSVVNEYVSERKQKAAIKMIFSRYVDPSVVDRLVEDPRLVRLGGERKNLTVLFSDIANFTGVSETLTPDDLVAHLNEYLTSMTEVVFDHAGTLDKYIGDAVIAFWGAPLELRDHAYRACRTAIEMTRRLKELNEKWAAEGRPILSFRIGINSGEMIVGNVGGKERFDYTVIGDNVNLASRLEGANKMYRTQILLSENTYEQVKEKIFSRELDLIIVKGRTRPVKIFELLAEVNDSIPEEKKKLVELYCTGLSKYRARQWGIAAGFFEKALAIDPNDYPSEMYLERCRLCEVEPPPADWDGVFVMETK